MANPQPTKHCRSCNRDLSPDDFAKDRTKPDGRCNTCKTCKYVYKREWQKRNRDKARSYGAKYDAKRAPIRKAQTEQRRAEHRAAKAQAKAQEKLRRTQRVCACGVVFYSQRPRSRCDVCRPIADWEWRKRWRSTPHQREKTKARNRRAGKRRYSSDLRYQLAQRFRVALRRTVADKGGRSAFAILGYTKDQLIRRLKQTVPVGYTWADALSGKLQIDHIDPITAFTFSSVDDPDFHRCWALSNLRLIPARDNLLKGDKLTRDFQPLLFPTYVPKSTGSPEFEIFA